LLAACASPQREPGGEAGPPLAAAAVHGEDEAVADSVDPAEKLPNVELSKDLLFRLLKAEMEAKEGQWQGPYVTMMSAAQQTRDPRLARRAAEVALAAKRNDEALSAIGLWRELSPDSDEAQQYYLGLAVLTGRMDEVETVLRRRLQEAGPATRPLVRFQAQQILSRARDREQSGKALERLLAPYADTVEAHVVLAQLALSRSQPEEAGKHAQRALEIKPDSEIAILTLAQVTPDQAEAAALLEKFVASHPKAREARLAHARILVGQKEYKQARAEFEALLKETPDNLNTLYALGIMSMQLNDTAAAEQHFKRFLAVLQEQPDEDREPGKVMMMLSQLAEEKGDLKGAQAWLEKIGEDDEGSWFTAQLKRAQLTAKARDVEGALQQLAAISPDEPAAQAQLVMVRGQILRDAGRTQEAYAVMQDGVRRYPGNTDLLYDFALMAEKLGYLTVMETTLREVMAQAPDNHHAYNALGYSLADRNVRLEEAYALIAKALQMAPGDPFIMDSMGWVLYRMGNLGEAERHLRRAYELRGDVEIAVHLGEVLWKQGRKADAQKLLRQARAKDPKNDTLRTTLTRLQLDL
jgi:tetratricopeptide (TPR) repeat protein